MLGAILKQIVGRGEIPEYVRADIMRIIPETTPESGYELEHSLCPA